MLVQQRVKIPVQQLSVGKQRCMRSLSLVGILVFHIVITSQSVEARTTNTTINALFSTRVDESGNTVLDKAFPTLSSDIQIQLEKTYRRPTPSPSTTPIPTKGQPKSPNNRSPSRFRPPTRLIYPTRSPSTFPTGTPSNSPSTTWTPSTTPTGTPSIPPTGTPSAPPTAKPSNTPTVTPSTPPTSTLSTPPTGTPSTPPTGTPSTPPTGTPSTPPTGTPSISPAAIPSNTPSTTPSTHPSNIPTLSPILAPTPLTADDPYVFPPKEVQFRILIRSFKKTPKITRRAFLHYKNRRGRQRIEQIAKKIIKQFKRDKYYVVEVRLNAVKQLAIYPEVDRGERERRFRPAAAIPGDERYAFSNATSAYINDEISFDGTNHSLLGSPNRIRRRRLAQVIPYGLAIVQAGKVKYNLASTLKPAICVIDQGLDSHVDLNLSVITGSNRLILSPFTLIEWSKPSGNHGTQVVGVMNALNNTGGTVGVDSNIRLFILNGAPFSEGDVYDSLQKCGFESNVRVINMSLQGGALSAALRTKMDELYTKNNIVLVGASGNTGMEKAVFPASYGKVISVSAVDESKRWYSLSDYSNQLELAAPGKNIYTTTTQNRYVTLQGTSFSAAYVSAIAAILMSHHPSCTNTQIRYAMAKTALNVGAAGCDRFTGYGIVQLKKAFDFLKANSCAAKTFGTLIGSGECSLL